MHKLENKDCLNITTQKKAKFTLSTNNIDIQWDSNFNKIWKLFLRNSLSNSKQMVTIFYYNWNNRIVERKGFYGAAIWASEK